MIYKAPIIVQSLSVEIPTPIVRNILTTIIAINKFDVAEADFVKTIVATDYLLN